MTKPEIKKELKQSFDAIQLWYKEQEDVKFEKGPTDRWNASQQLDHLHKTTKVINKAMALNKMILRLKFGKRKKEQLSFEEIRALYQGKINNLPEDFKQPLPPKSYSADLKLTRLKKYSEQEKTMYSQIDKWNDRDLNKYVLPHPVMGNFSIREWLMFNVIHNKHHLDILQRDYTE